MQANGRLVFFGGTIVIGSLLVWASARLDVPSVVRAFIAAPGTLALCAAVWQIWRDHERFEQSRRLQREAGDFSLSISSHMANTVFDRYVQFCGMYVKALNDGV